jgi:hypothetical protein
MYIPKLGCEYLTRASHHKIHTWLAINLHKSQATKQAIKKEHAQTYKQRLQVYYQNNLKNIVYKA